MTACFKTPRAVVHARDNGSITPEQLDIFTYCYAKATLPEYRVYSYSAANVCQFRGLDATTANIKRYERAAADLLDRHTIRRDYYHINPTRSQKAGRTYSVWVPAPERFQHVGTPQENEVSLWRPNVGLLDTDNVGLPTDGTQRETGSCSKTQSDNVGLLGGSIRDNLSITHYVDQNPEKESPLPPAGVLPPAPQGEHSDAVGLENRKPKRGQRKPLNPKQCELLHEAATQYAALASLIYRPFMPDVDDTANLLRDFEPAELLCAQVKQFPLGSRVSNSAMANFFGGGAKTLIEAARLNGVSRAISTEELDLPLRTLNVPDFSQKWKIVLDAWRAVFG